MLKSVHTSARFREYHLFSLIHAVANNLIYNVYIRLEKHLQCEKLLGLARGTTKKRGNKKSDELYQFISDHSPVIMLSTRMDAVYISTSASTTCRLFPIMLA